MRLWRSVVGKLWITIILLLSVVLFILTILLLEFFENYIVDQAEEDLNSTSKQVAHFVEEMEDGDLALKATWNLIDDANIIVQKGNEYSFSPNIREDKKQIEKFLKEDSYFKNSANGTEMRKKETTLNLTKEGQSDQIYIVSMPFTMSSGEKGAVYLYQPLSYLQEPSRQTTKFILLAAGIAIILTTIFAFFLSTRITAPLRKMKQAAFEVTKGNFDTKVPILTYDEIGELAIAFNQMGRQLKYNLNALNQEKEQLSSILSSMADGVITFSRNGTILITNPPAEQFLQASLYEQKIDITNASGLSSKVQRLLEEVVQTEQEQVTEMTVQGRTWVILMSPLYNQTKIRGAVAVIRDMTEERRLDKLRQDFVANVSHELRTPISMLQGYSEAIVDDIASTEEEMKEIAKVIHDESLRMGRLVNELLDLARMEAGHIRLSIDEVDIESFTERVLRKFQGVAKEENIELHLSLESLQRQEVKMDADKLEQVLTNLIDNAIRHTQGEGAVTLEVESLPSALSLKVQDTGAGIAEEDLPFVFERFYKGDKARTRGKAGTGLGLAIAKNIVEAHEGTIRVHSTLGKGTTFSIRLPQ
ncbi:ATP-binding protein [Priestia endophytica]|uniref:histidine kinase n=1 Tax=Priestia endophytica TaxID=135735 RepID=A0AAX1QCW9_9BACI|nr:ATP-binding protein [Priestia endophytica]RAS79341.1 PAS domain-containing sensor histidine kinase [Priestia endophytica]RAS84014.1 PAS domain-containing sensor histidine kinase [Priestia endophytica]